MATQKLNLTRDQLATFLKNHEQIKQFERLFQLADEIAPSSDTTGISIQAGNAEAAANEAVALIVSLAQEMAINSNAADQKAVQALDMLGRIANSLEILATAPVIQNNNSVVTDYIDLPEDGPHVTQARRVQWNQDDGTMDVGLYGGSVLQVGQELMFYAKNTSGSLIANGTPVMFTGTIGSSGKLTFGLAVADGSVPSDYMMGVATQDIANNAFGYVTSFGLVRGFNTTGAPYGETWNDGDLLYFGAASPGTWTKVQPIAPRIDVPVAVVVNAGSGGSGSIFVRMTIAESLARLQDVYISGLANGDLLQYDSVQQRWENVPASTLPVGTATNLAGGAAGSVPYQTAPGTTTFLGIGSAYRFMRTNAGATAPEWATFTAGTAISIANGVGALTITNTAPDQIVSLTGAGTTSISGTYPNFTITSNDAFVGTVTSVAALTLGTTGTDLSSTVANGTTTPVITLNVPTASATNRGALSSTDWSTFNGKQAALVSGANIKTVNGTTLLGSGDLGTITVPYGGTGRTSFTSNFVPYGNGTGALNISSGFQFDGSNLGVGSAPVSGFKVACNGDQYFGNGGSARIGRIWNDAGWFSVQSDYTNVNGLKLDSASAIRFDINNTRIANIDSGAFYPQTDNARSIGYGSFRWSVIYAASGTINTSDAKTKTDIAELDEAERRVALRLKKLIKKFRFIESVTKKGDEARIHVGVIAQEVMDAFKSEGLDANKYALFCFDEWEDQYESEFEQSVILDENGDEQTILVDSGRKKLVREAGILYGIRYEQLLAFVIAAI